MALFQAAINKNDKDKVTALTSFPFELRGVDDSISSQSLNKESFKNMCERLMMQKNYTLSGEKLTSKSMRELVLQTKNITPQNFENADTVRFHQFIFVRKNNQWFFVQAYLEE